MKDRLPQLLLVGGPLAGILALTRDRTKFPADPWVGVGVAIVAAVFLAGARGRPRRLDALVAAAIGVAAATAHLHPQVVNGHDLRTQIWAAFSWQHAWHAGDFWPVWLHDVGLGQPVPLFYGPLPYQAMAPFALAGAGPAGMLAGSIVLASAVAALTAWRAVAHWTGSRGAALVAATAWSFAPYRLLDANYRLAIAETWALSLLPWALLAYERLLGRGGAKRIRSAAVATTLVTLAHPLSLAMLAPALVLMALMLSPPRPRRVRRTLLRYGRCLAAGAAGLALAGMLVVPLAAEKKYLSLDRSFMDAGSYVAESVHPRQLLVRQLWKYLLWSETLEDEGRPDFEEMPFYVGFALAGALVIGLATSDGTRRRSRRARALATLGLVALALTCDPVTRATAQLPLFSWLQFPWRWLGPASAAAALTLGLLAARFEHREQGRLVVTALLLVTLADGFPYSGAATRIPHWEGLAMVEKGGVDDARPRPAPRPWPVRVVGGFLPPSHGDAEVGLVWPTYQEYFTETARSQVEAENWAPLAVGLIKHPGDPVRVDSLPYARLERGRRPPRPLRFAVASGRITVWIPPRGGRVVVAEQYFPGWQERTSSGWREARADALGLLTTDAPRGVGMIEFRFDRWRSDRLLGWLVSAATASALAFAAARESAARRGRRRKEAST